MPALIPLIVGIVQAIHWVREKIITVDGLATAVERNLMVVTSESGGPLSPADVRSRVDAAIAQQDATGQHAAERIEDRHRD